MIIDPIKPDALRGLLKEIHRTAPDAVPEPVFVGRHWSILGAPTRRASHHQHFDKLALTIGDPSSFSEGDRLLLAEMPPRCVVHVAETTADALAVVRWWWLVR